MASKPLLILTSILSGLSITSLLITLGLPQQAIAQVVSSTSHLNQITFEPPPGQDSPDQTAGGGSRGEGQCLADLAVANSGANPREASSPAVALRVVSGEETTDPYPTIAIQVPETSATAATFSFLTGEGHVVYEAAIPIEHPGIVSVALPEHQPGLDVGERYYWMFALVCDPENRLLDIAIGGTVHRVDSHASHPSWQ